jgi:hypothetical protein
MTVSEQIEILFQQLTEAQKIELIKRLAEQVHALIVPPGAFPQIGSYR